jgi:hypothetical protein
VIATALFVPLLLLVLYMLHPAPFRCERLYHWLNGVWSNIPLCCIAYWNAGNTGVSRDKPDPWAGTEDAAEYVRCNECVAKHRVNKIRNNGRVCSFLVGYWR